MPLKCPIFAEGEQIANSDGVYVLRLLGNEFQLFCLQVKTGNIAWSQEIKGWPVPPTWEDALGQAGIEMGLREDQINPGRVENTVYVLEEDIEPENSSVLAIDARTESPKWEVDTPQHDQVYLRGTWAPRGTFLTADEGGVYCIVFNLEGPEIIFKLDPENGDIKWQTTIDLSFWGYLLDWTRHNM